MSKRKSQTNLFSFYNKKAANDPKGGENVIANDASVNLICEAASISNLGEEMAINEFDIGHYVNVQTIPDNLKHRLLVNPWIPTVTYKFPNLVQSGRTRYFQRSWLDEFVWLTYSAKDAGGYCKACILFGAKAGGRSRVTLGSLVLTPFKNFKKGKEMLRAHASNEYHKTAVAKCSQFKKTFEDETQSIEVILNSEVKKRIEENRARLIPIIKTIILCGRQNFPLRGHRDDGELVENADSTNDGNFRSLLRFRIDAGDVILNNHISTAPKNASFISKTTQNELIEACGEVILHKIVESIKAGQYFSVLADETTDIGAVEQMSLSIRFLDTVSFQVREEFLGFMEARDLSGEGLTNLLLEKLNSLGLEIKNMRGQGYDGGSNMSGKIKGVQARIREKQPLAIYMHCASHKLNLSISKACSSQNVRNAIAVVSDVTNLVKDSSKRTVLMKAQISEHYPQETSFKLKKLCETRWVERHDAFLHFLHVFDAIVCFLQVLDAEAPSSKSAVLLASVLRFDFIITLHIVSSIFSLTVALSRQLQNPSLDLKRCYSMVENVIDTLQEYRNSPSRYAEAYIEAMKSAEKHEVDITMPRISKRQIHRPNVAASSPKEYYRLNVFLPFVDHLISELGRRFSSTDHADVIQLYGLIPSYANQDSELLLEAAASYSNDLPGTLVELSGEIDLWRTRWRNKSKEECPSSAVESLVYASDGFYPNIKVLLHILSVLPVTTCTSERSFSTLRRVKTYLRSNMIEERLNGLVLLNVHRSMEVLPEDVLEKFAQKHNRKMQLLYL